MARYILSDLFLGDYPITQLYGANPQNYPMFAIPGHEGVDWGTPNGTPILAPFDGKILRDTLDDKDYGNFTVVWDLNQHCAVWYCHLQSVSTSIGSQVTRGQVIGYTNNTGHSTGPHLHVNFVETDNDGNRLNRDNGKQGFLDILDPNLISWQLGGIVESEVNDQTKISKTLLGTDQDLEIQQIRGLLADEKREHTDLDNARSENGTLKVTLRNSQADYAELDAHVKDLQAQIVSLKTAAETPATPQVDPQTDTQKVNFFFGLIGAVVRFFSRK